MSAKISTLVYMIWGHVKTHLVTAVPVQTSSPSFNTIIKGNRYLDYSLHFCKALCYSQKVRALIMSLLYPSQDENTCSSTLTVKEKKELRFRNVKKICPRLTSKEWPSR